MTDNKIIDALSDAIYEAHRFIKAASAAKRRLKTDTWASTSGSKEMGGAKRASMDLARALAAVRRPM